MISVKILFFSVALFDLFCKKSIIKYPNFIQLLLYLYSMPENYYIQFLYTFIGLWQWLHQCRVIEGSEHVRVMTKYHKVIWGQP